MTESRADLLLALLRERYGVDAELHDQGDQPMSDLTLPEGFEYCTTWSRRKRHISNNLTADRHAPRQKGRGGRTVCGEYGSDQERAQAELDSWGSHKKLDVASLPLCGRCAKSTALTGVSA